MQFLFTCFRFSSCHRYYTSCSFLSNILCSFLVDRWMAPEVIRHERYCEGADVYSFGTCVFSLIVFFVDRFLAIVYHDGGGVEYAWIPSPTLYAPCPRSSEVTIVLGFTVLQGHAPGQRFLDVVHDTCAPCVTFAAGEKIETDNPTLDLAPPTLPRSTIRISRTCCVSPLAFFL